MSEAIPHFTDLGSASFRLAPVLTVRAFSTNYIRDEVAIFYDISPSAITGQSRYSPIVRARHTAMYLVRELTDFSYTHIGGYFGRDHSTVVHAVQRVKARLEREPKLAAEIETIKARLNEVWG